MGRGRGGEQAKDSKRRGDRDAQRHEANGRIHGPNLTLVTAAGKFNVLLGEHIRLRHAERDSHPATMNRVIADIERLIGHSRAPLTASPRVTSRHKGGNSVQKSAYWERSSTSVRPA